MERKGKQKGKTFWRLGEGEGVLSSDEDGLLLALEKDPLLRLVETMLLLRSCFVFFFSLQPQTHRTRRRENKERKGI